MLYDSPVRAIFMKMALMPQNDRLFMSDLIRSDYRYFSHKCLSFWQFFHMGIARQHHGYPITAMVIMPLAVCFLILNIFQLQFLIAPLFDFALRPSSQLRMRWQLCPLSDISIKMPQQRFLFALIIVSGVNCLSC